MEETRKQAKKQLTKSLDILKILDNTNFDLDNYINVYASLWNSLDLGSSIKGPYMLDMFSNRSFRYNIFQIMPIYNSKGKIDEVASFNMAIKNIIKLATKTDKDLNNYDTYILSGILTHFYYDTGIIRPNLNGASTAEIVNMPNNQWPTLSDFRNYLALNNYKVLYRLNPDENTRMAYQKLMRYFANLDAKFGICFNGHTNFDVNKLNTTALKLIKLILTKAQHLTKGEFIKRLAKQHFLDLDTHTYNMDITYIINKMFEF